MRDKERELEQIKKKLDSQSNEIASQRRKQC